MATFKKDILIVKFGALGDVVRTSYALPALAAKYSDARIHWLTADGAVELLRFNPYIYNLATPGAGFVQLRSIAFDVAVSLDDEWEVLERLNELKIGRIIGARLHDSKRTYCQASSAWFDMGLISRFGKTRADELKRLNQREHQSFLEEMLGIRIERPTFFNSSVLVERVKEMFEPQYFHIGLNGGAGARWPSKQISLSEATKLVSKLVNCRVGGRPVKVWLLGGREEADRHRQICAAVPSQHLVDSGYDQNICEFAARIKALDYLITTDSLALHLGISQGIPNLSVYAPTSAAEIGTFGTGVKIVSTARDYCNYRPDADNSTNTAARIIEQLYSHLEALGSRLDS